MLISIITSRNEVMAFRASDVAAVRQTIVDGRAFITVHFCEGHPLHGSWQVAEIATLGHFLPVSESAQVIEAINIALGEGS